MAIMKFLFLFLFLFGGLNARAQQAEKKVIYPKETVLDLEGARIEGELKNPGEFYFQHRVPEKMDSLVKRRRNFHREMLRDSMMGR